MSEFLKEKIIADFNRIAAFEKEDWTRNNHFSNFLLKNLPENCRNVLEIGYGIGTFTRKLAAARSRQVTAVDLAPKMIETARELSAAYDNIEYQLADILETDFPPAHFDTVVSIATFHHIPPERVLPKLSETLKPGGRLLVLDLLEMENVWDYLLGAVSVPIGSALKIFHNGFVAPTRAERAAWDEHAKTDRFLTYREAREIYSKFLPGAVVERRLFFRYTAVWEK